MKSITLYPPTKPIQATVAIPGSKSYTNRALVLAAMTPGKVTLHNPLFSDDTHALIGCLRTLGIRVHTLAQSIEVEGSIDDVKEGKYELDANLSGTTIRFMLALLTIVPGTKTIGGGAGLTKRPIQDLVNALRELGASITYLEKEGFPPLAVASSRLMPGTVHLSGATSSQYLSALLMVAPYVGDITIEIEGAQISKPYINMTIASMREFGVEVVNRDPHRYELGGKRRYEKKEYEVEGDYSSAGYFFAAAVLASSVITVENLNPKSLQADKKLLDVLATLGAKITEGKGTVTVERHGNIKPFAVDVIDFPDQAQTLAVLAAFASGMSVISGIRSLRVKETDRVAALVTELGKLGIKAKATEDTLTIEGGSPKATTVDTYGDHRMAMSFALMGIKLAGVTVRDPGVVGKTFPGFWQTLQSIGVRTAIDPDASIVLIGMRGSGKTTVGRILAGHLKRPYLDTDALIVQKVGMSVPEIVKKYGWNFFRDRESKVTEEVSHTERAVISTGGGVVTKERNVECLKKNGFLVYLEASLETLEARIGDDPNRPALTKEGIGLGEVREVLEQRDSLYRSAADIVIKTDARSPEKIAYQIIHSAFPELV